VTARTMCHVLLKRRLLMRAGWPREALLVTVVRNRNDEGHAVLMVKTDRGEFILDNQADDVLPFPPIQLGGNRFSRPLGRPL
jgi:predicted transglutaminase-like cysteine proteinase